MKKVILYAIAGAVSGVATGYIAGVFDSTEPTEPAEPKKPFQMPSALVALGIRLLPMLNAIGDDLVAKGHEFLDNLHDQAHSPDEQAGDTADKQTEAAK